MWSIVPMLIRYNPKLRVRASGLRTNQTRAESLLWDKIRGKKIRGRQFLRQRPIGNYIVDFLCMELKLVIEIDGLIHELNKDLDRFRQEQLELLGFKVVRFTNKEVEEDIHNVVQKIYQLT